MVMMPYVITTKRPDQRPSRVGHADDLRVVSRRAVATLEDAQRMTRNLLIGKHWDDRNRDTSSRWVARARNLPESGGTVGPLPDGTVIEVQAVTLSALGVKAYNAAQGS